jgi:hypothetical protein
VASGAAVLHGAAGEQRGYRWADPLATVPFFGYSYIFKLIQIEMVKMGHSGDRKFSYKISGLRELNMEQISSLEFFKIHNGN